MARARKGGAKKGPNKIVVVGGLLVIVILAVFVVAQFQSPDMPEFELWYTDSSFEEAKKRVKRLQRQCQEAYDQRHAYELERQAFRAKSRDFWIPRRDGDPDTAAQGLIENAAAKAGLVLNQINTPRKSNVREGVAIYELSVSAKASVEEVYSFLAEVYLTTPCFYWQHLSVQPDNLRNPTNVRVSGRLRFMAITHEELVKFLL